LAPSHEVRVDLKLRDSTAREEHDWIVLRRIIGCMMPEVDTADSEQDSGEENRSLKPLVQKFFDESELLLMCWSWLFIWLVIHG
jgi:hypothetical protein